MLMPFGEENLLAAREVMMGGCFANAKPAVSEMKRPRNNLSLALVRFAKCQHGISLNPGDAISGVDF